MLIGGCSLVLSPWSSVAFSPDVEFMTPSEDGAFDIFDMSHTLFGVCTISPVERVLVTFYSFVDRADDEPWVMLRANIPFFDFHPVLFLLLPSAMFESERERRQ